MHAGRSSVTLGAPPCPRRLPADACAHGAAPSPSSTWPSTAQRLHGTGAGLPRARPRGRDALHRRAPARAAGACRAQPHHGRALRAGRAVHRAASRQHRRAARTSCATCCGRRQLGRAGGPRRAACCGRPTGSSRWVPARARDGGTRHARRAPWSDVCANPASRIGPFLGRARACPACARRAAAAPVRARATIRLSTARHPYGACRSTVEHPDGPAGGRHGRVGLGQDHARAGKPGARAGGAACRRRRCPAHVRARRRRRTSRRSTAHRRHAHRGRTCAPPWPPTPTCYDDLRRLFAAHRRRAGSAASRPGTSPTTRARCAAPPATARARSSLDVQFLPDVDIDCPACRGSPLRAARLARCAMHARARRANSRCREVMAMHRRRGGSTCSPAERRVVRASCETLQRPGTGLSDARRGDAQRFRAARRSA